MKRIKPLLLKVFIPRVSPEVSIAYSCRIRTHEVCTFTSFFGGKGIVKNVATESSLNPQLCKTYVNQVREEKSPVFQGQNVSMQADRVWSSMHTMRAKYYWCCYTHCQNVSNLIIEKDEVASVQSDLGDIGHCLAKVGHCQNKHATIIWQARELVKRANCTHEFKGEYMARKSGNFVIIETLQVAYTLTAEYKDDCMGRYYRTKQGGTRIKIAYFTAGPRRMTRPRRSTFSRNLDPDPINGKLQFLEFQINQNLETQFASLWTQFCALQRTVASHTLQLFRIDPTIGARSLLNRDDIYAAYAGDAKMIWTCRNVTATRVFYDHKVNGHCCEYQPVSIHRSLYYVAPGTRDLVTSSPRVDCTHRVAPVHRVNGAWVSSSGPQQVQTIEPESPIKLNPLHFTFTAPAVFHSHANTEPFTVAMLRDTVNRLRYLQHGFDRLVNYTAEMALDPDALKAQLVGAGSMVEQTIAGLGESAGTYVEHALIGVGTAVNKVVSQPVQLLINSLVVLAVVALILLVIYFLLTRRATSVMFRRVLVKRSTGVRRKKAPDIAVSFQKGDSGTSDSSQFLKRSPENSKPTSSSALQSELKKWPGTAKKVLKSQPHTTLATLATNNRAMTMTAIATPVDSPNGKSLSVLWDTGCTDTMMSAQSATELGLKVVTSPSQGHAQLADGKQLKISGVVAFNLTIGSVSFKNVQATVADLSTHAIFLGLDFMTRVAPYTVSFSQNGTGTIVTADGQSLPFGKPPEFLTRAVVPETVVIPPRHSANLRLKLASPTRAGDHLLLTPLAKNIARIGLLLTAAVVTVRNDPLNSYQYVCVHVANPHIIPCKLYANQNLATLQPMHHSYNPLVNPISHTIPELEPHSTQGAQWEEIATQIKLDSVVATDQQKAQLESLLSRKKDLFALSMTDLGRTNVVKMAIHTEHSKPIASRPYRIPHQLRKVLNHKVRELEDAKLIVKRSSSPYASPVLLVPKGPGPHDPNNVDHWRLVIDYRKLNANTKPDSHPLPLIQDILDKLGNASVFSTIDLKAGYHQVELEQDAKEKTAFVTHSGLYQYEVLLFGVTGGPACFVRLMNQVLSDLDFCQAYLDDVIIWSPDHETHLKHLQIVMDRLRAAGLKMGMSKCLFMQPEVHFLGHVVGRRGVQPDPKKVEAITKWPEPDSATAVRSFLGLIGYYRRFVPGFAYTARCLHNLTHEGTSFNWTTECHQAFETLKQKLLSNDLLAFPNLSQPMIISTDASDFAIGAVLSQEIDGHERPIAYTSRVLSRPERNYPTVEREALAVVDALQKFRCYTFGVPTRIIVDHAPLVWLLKGHHKDGRLARWACAIQGNNIEIVHKPGKKHTNADALSRACIPGSEPSTPTDPTDLMYCCTISTDPQLQPPQQLQANHTDGINHQQTSTAPSTSKSAPVPENSNDLLKSSPMLNKLQRDDHIFGKIIVFLESGDLPPDDDEARRILLEYANYSLLPQTAGALYRLDKVGKPLKKAWRLFIPKDLRQELLSAHHEEDFGGHTGVSRMYSRLAERYFWPGMFVDVLTHVSNCVTCNTCKTGRPAIPGSHFILFPLVTNPLTVVSLIALAPSPFPYTITCTLFSSWMPFPNGSKPRQCQGSPVKKPPERSLNALYHVTAVLAFSSQTTREISQVN